MNDQAGWRAWSGGWHGGQPPENWWLSADGRWYPPGVQRPPGGPTWRGSAAEYRPRQFADAGARTMGGVSVVTRPHVRSASEGDGAGDGDGGSAPRHAAHRTTGSRSLSRSRRGSAGRAAHPAAAGSARAEVRSLVRTTVAVLAAALAAVVGLALWSIRSGDEPSPSVPSVSSEQPAGPAADSVTPEAPASTVLPPAGEIQRVP